MAITTDVRKFGDTIVAQGKLTITETTKPLYAIVGANDLAVEKLREGFGTLPTTVRTLPTTVKSKAGSVTGKATEVYGELSDRGVKLVTQIRRRPATRTAIARNKQVARSAKATRTSTAKAAKASATAVEQAAGQIG
jgi:hypothetical protein